MKEFEYAGFWWLPAQPEKKVAGTLTFTEEDGLHLRLLGVLADCQSVLSGTSSSHPIVLGVTSGKLITLQDNYPSGGGLSAPDFAKEALRPRFAYVGRHFAEPKDVRFNKVHVRYTHLTAWAHHRSFELLNLDEETGGCDLRYTRPPEPEAKGQAATVAIRYFMNVPFPLRHRADLTQRVVVEIESEPGLDMQELQTGFVRPIQDLLTLATTEPNYVVDLRCIANVGQSPDEDDPIRPVEVFYAKPFRSEPRKVNLSATDMLLPLGDMRGDSGKVLPRWLAVWEELGGVCTLFFGIQYHPTSYIEHRFQSSIQAVEAYHRSRGSNRLMSRAAYRERVRRIIQHVPKDESQWVRDQLRHGNEPRLRDRILALLEKLEVVMAPLVGDVQVFANRVKDIRNSYAHPDTDRLSSIDAEELFRITQALGFLLQACLLAELGFSPEKCRGLLQEHPEYRFAVRQSVGEEP